MRRLILLLVCSLLAAGAAAERSVDLYRAETLVTSRSDGERTRAIRDQFAELVVRMSGNWDAIEHPAVRDALTRAQDYLLEFSYASTEQTVTVDGAQVPATRLVLRYSPQAVEQLLRSAGLSLWPANRPAVLVWLVEDRGGQRSLTTDSEQREFLRRRANQRGLPLILPLMDLEDRLAINEDELWRMDEGAIRDASERYRPNAILVGRYSETSSGVWRSNWQLYHSLGNPLFEGEGDTAETLLTSAVDAVADYLASLYAIVPQQHEDPDALVLQVAGIRDFAAYKALQRYLQELALVRRVELVSARHDTLVLRLYVEGDVGRLTSALSLDSRLVPWEEAGQISLPGDRYQPRGTLVNPLVYNWRSR